MLFPTGIYIYFFLLGWSRKLLKSILPRKEWQNSNRRRQVRNIHICTVLLGSNQFLFMKWSAACICNHSGRLYKAHWFNRKYKLWYRIYQKLNYLYNGGCIWEERIIIVRKFWSTRCLQSRIRISQWNTKEWSYRSHQ